MPDQRQSSLDPPPPIVDEADTARDRPTRPTSHCVIESIGVYLPAGVESTREVLDGCADTSWLSPERAVRVERLTGIRTRRVAGEHEASIDLAKNAIAKCLALSVHGPSDIDLLISCSLSRYEGPNRYALEPSAAVRLGAHFGFDNALTFDLTNGCAGMFTAIKIAGALIRARLVGVAMIVSGEHVTDLMRTAQKEITGRLLSDPRFACLTLGDSGVALTLTESPHDGTGFHAIDLYTAGQYSRYSVAKPTDRAHGGLIMFTESVKLFDVAIRHSAAHVVELLEAFGWREYQPAHVIVHQSGHMAVYEAARQLNALVQREMCHDANMIDNIAERGNTVTTSHFVAVWDNILNGRIRSRDDVLFAIQGSGLTVGTAPYTFDDLPDRLRRAESGDATSRPALGGGRRRAAFPGRAPRVRIESVGAIQDAACSGRGLGLAAAAVERCLAGSTYRSDDVELLIYAGTHRDEFIGEPAIAALIAGQAKLNEAGASPSGRTTLAFDIFNGSVGFLNACSIGAGLIQSRECDTVMVVASEIAGEGTAPRGQPGIAGGGGAVILDRSPDPAVGFGACVFRRFGEYLAAHRTWVVNEDGRARMHVERDPGIEAAYLACMPSTVADCLRAEGLSRHDVTVVLPPLPSAEFSGRLADALGVGRDRVIDVGASGDDLGPTTLAHLLLTARQRGGARPGDVGLLVSVGSGGQVGAAIYFF